MANRFPFLDHPLPIAFSHAGGGEENIENSWPAFEATVALGYRYLETDCVATRDGVLLLYHDTSLDGMTDRRGDISTLDYAEVSQARIYGKEPIPRLDEVIDRWPDLRLNLEPKSDQAVEPLIDWIRRTNKLDQVCVGSFADRRIRRMREALGPGLCTSIGPVPVGALRLSSWGVPFVDRLVTGSGAACVQVPVKESVVPIVDGRFVDRCHELDLQVQVWTIDSPNEINDLLDLGADGIMTNRPTVLKAVLQERGVWTDN